MALFSMYSRKCPTVHASTKFSQRNAVGRANGLRPISWDVLSADDQIQIKGRRKITRKTIRMAYVATRPVRRPRLKPREAMRVSPNVPLVAEVTATVRPPVARAGG